MTTTQSTTPQAPSTGAQASLYQQLRAHLATLKLADAAEHLPAVLDAAAEQDHVVVDLAAYAAAAAGRNTLSPQPPTPPSETIKETKQQ